MRSKGGVGVCARTYDYGQASEYIQCCDSPASAAGGHGCSFLLLTAIATFSGDLQDDFSVPLSCYLDLLLRFHSSSSSRRKSRELIDNVAVRRKRQLSLAWIHSQVGIGMWRYKMTKAAVGERSRDRRPACFIRRLEAFVGASSVDGSYKMLGVVFAWLAVTRRGIMQKGDEASSASSTWRCKKTTLIRFESDSGAYFVDGVRFRWQSTRLGFLILCWAQLN
ncbi:hypothetical protein BHM03_00015096 [Ensete ventricosum]|nr:hypothetical protein BHM03_00015096 [Ensete ventricosum]